MGELEKRVPSAAEQSAEKVAVAVKSLPQALKRGPIFSDLAAPFGFAQGRLELVPFPNRLEPEFSRNG